MQDIHFGGNSAAFNAFVLACHVTTPKSSEKCVCVLNSLEPQSELLQLMMGTLRLNPVFQNW